MGFDIALMYLFNIGSKFIDWIFTSAELPSLEGDFIGVNLGGVMISITMFGILIRTILSIPKGQGRLSVSSLRRKEDE